MLVLLYLGILVINRYYKLTSLLPPYVYRAVGDLRGVDRRSQKELSCKGLQTPAQNEGNKPNGVCVTMLSNFVQSRYQSEACCHPMLDSEPSTLRPTMPITIRLIQAIRLKFAVSLNQTIPIIATPTAPIPVQIA